jgi:hypothetical protein
MRSPYREPIHEKTPFTGSAAKGVFSYVSNREETDQLPLSFFFIFSA